MENSVLTPVPIEKIRADLSDAYNKIYQLEEKIKDIRDHRLNRDISIKVISFLIGLNIGIWSLIFKSYIF